MGRQRVSRRDSGTHRSHRDYVRFHSFTFFAWSSSWCSGVYVGCAGIRCVDAGQSCRGSHIRQKATWKSLSVGIKLDNRAFGLVFPSICWEGGRQGHEICKGGRGQLRLLRTTCAWPVRRFSKIRCMKTSSAPAQQPDTKAAPPRYSRRQSRRPANRTLSFRLSVLRARQTYTSLAITTRKLHVGATPGVLLPMSPELTSLFAAHTPSWAHVCAVLSNAIPSVHLLCVTAA